MTTASATTKDAQGNALTNRTIVWTAGPTSVATISQSGLITAVAPGTATITAISEGVSGFALLLVTQAAVNTVTVSAPAPTIYTGANAAFTVTLRDLQGNTLTNRLVIWSTSAGAVAVVDGDGVVTPKSPGVVAISATSEGKVGSVIITVKGWFGYVVPDPLEIGRAHV